MGIIRMIHFIICVELDSKNDPCFFKTFFANRFTVLLLVTSGEAFGKTCEVLHVHSPQLLQGMMFHDVIATDEVLC